MAPGRRDGIRCNVDGNLLAASCFGGPHSNGVQVFAGRHEDRHDPSARTVLEPLLRRAEAQPPVHDRRPVAYSLYVDAQGVPYF